MNRDLEGKMKTIESLSNDFMTIHTIVGLQKIEKEANGASRLASIHSTTTHSVQRKCLVEGVMGSKDSTRLKCDG